VVSGATQHFADQSRSETCEDLLYGVKQTERPPEPTVERRCFAAVNADPS